MTNLIFWHFSPTFLQLSLSCFTLFPFFFFPRSWCSFSQSILWIFLFPLKAPLLSASVLSPPVLFEEMCVLPSADRHRRCCASRGVCCGMDESLSALDICLEIQGMFLSILLSGCTLSSPTLLCVNTVKYTVKGNKYHGPGTGQSCRWGSGTLSVLVWIQP